MVNKVFKEHIEEVNNKEAIFKEIITKEKRRGTMKKRIFNIAATFLVVMIIGVTSSQIYAKIQWNIQFKEYKDNMIYPEEGSLEEAKENGYAEVINMNFVEKDGISIKVDSMLITDDCFDANITFKFNEDVVVDTESFSFGCAIYDENRNIYAVSNRISSEIKQKRDYTIINLYKELGINYNKKDIYKNILANQFGIRTIEVNPNTRTITSNINVTTRKSFPKSKKIYIRIFNPGYTMYEIENNIPQINNAEDFSMSKYIWNFEIEVPEKFYERETIELRPESDIPGIEIQKITVTESGMVLKFKSEEYNKMIFEGKDMPSEEFSRKQNEMLNISDETGKVYSVAEGGTTGEENTYSFHIDINKNDLDKKLYINFMSNGIVYTRELLVK